MLEHVYAFDEHSYAIAVGPASANIPVHPVQGMVDRLSDGISVRFPLRRALCRCRPLSGVRRWARGFLENRIGERELMETFCPLERDRYQGCSATVFRS